MKIQELRIRNFGKLSEKELQFSDGINLIYGENESGKSTIHTFIRSMLFGMERGRGRAAAGDTYSQYEPWDNPALYSGKMKFESGGKSFWIDRNFDKYTKKAEMFCEDDGEELSVEDGDLHMILGELTESVYDNTISVGQLKSEPGQPLAAQLKNYATSYYTSGNGELDFSGALEHLRESRRQIERDIKEELEKKQQKRERIEQETSYVWREMHRLQEETDSLKESIKNRREREKTPDETENKGVIDELRSGRWRIHPLEIIGFIAAVIAVCLLIQRPWNYLVAIVLTLLCLIYTWNRMKVSKKQEKTEPERLLEEIMPQEEKIPLERLLWEAEHNEQELKEKQIQYENLREQLGELDEMGEKFSELERRKAALELASEQLTELSLQLQKQMEERMNEKVSHIICKITGGKYTRLTVSGNLRMSLVQDGRRIPAERLSEGTAEQVYLALRTASSDILYGEEFPLILDDTFAYYDDVRLEHVLRWLAERNQQIIVFTCQKREEEILKRCKIPYKKCEI